MTVHQHKRGFSLIELVLALALGGIILTAASSYLFSISNLWAQTESHSLFEEHVNGVTSFVEHAFNSAEANTAGGGNGETSAVSWKELPGGNAIDESLLAFRLSGEVPILVDESSYIPAANCFLKFDANEGLSLIWQTDAMAQEDDDDLRTTRLSNLVSEVVYHYYDSEAEEWEDSTEAEENDEGESKLPDFMQLKFAHPDGREYETFILLPSDNNDIPSL